MVEALSAVSKVGSQRAPEGCEISDGNQYQASEEILFTHKRVTSISQEPTLGGNRDRVVGMIFLTVAQSWWRKVSMFPLSGSI